MVAKAPGISFGGLRRQITFFRAAFPTILLRKIVGNAALKNLMRLCKKYSAAYGGERKF